MSDSKGVMAELSRAEIDSLMCCPTSDNFNPAPGNRTAYIKIRLKALKLVRPLWVEDGDEVYFTCAAHGAWRQNA